LKEWAAREGIGYATARRWFTDGLLPVPARPRLLLPGGHRRADAAALIIGALADAG